MPGVVVVLVSHDGATWLPAVTEGIRSQTSPVAAVVAVDTGSRDDSPQLIEQGLAGTPTLVLAADGSTSYPRAVELARAEIAARGLDPDWLWLLHDDANPAPDALARLLAAAADRPDAEFLGPKLREWPSLRRLLELGVTISGTGRRETGLERGEYDQGQHDEVREVFAVNSAGLLVRPAAFEAVGGYDEHLPMFGNDLDLGWRAAAAGKTTLIVPQAVVFHAEAAHRGVRRTALTGRHTHFQERRAALWTLLVNVRAAWLPLQLLRLVGGTLLRVLGFLVVRSPGEALDELAALLNVVARPGAIRSARRERARRREAGAVDRDRVRRLLAPWWLPYRHGLDFVSDLAAAATNQAADVAERRREAAAARDPQLPAARHRDEEDEFADTGLVVRFLTDPVAVALALLTVALVVGARGAFGEIVGGALAPAPTSAGDWWRLHVDSHHTVGFGSDAPAPAYVLPLALLASLLGPQTTMSVLLVTAAPLALWGAWRFMRVVGRLMTRYGAPRWLLLWGAGSWALVPLVAGAWDGGRWGVVLAGALLPWLAHAALGFADPDPGRRWRAGWRVGLLLALGASIAPGLWLVVALLAAAVLVAALLIAPSLARDRTVWAPPSLAVALPVGLLLPWWLPAVLTGAAEGLLLDVGRWPTSPSDGIDLVLGRLGGLGGLDGLDGLGAPWWLGVVLPVLALLALVPRATRIGAAVCWLVAAVAAVVAVPLVLVEVDLTGAAGQQLGLGAVLLVLQGAWITAVVVAGVTLTDNRLPRLGQAGIAVTALAAVLAPVAGLAWFVGWGGDELGAEPDSGIPVYMQQAAAAGPGHGVLVIRGEVADGLSYTVVRDDGPTVGEDEIAALTPEKDAVNELIRTLTTAPSSATVDDLRRRGIAYVVLPAPADGEVAARLDATQGLVRASAADRSTRAWELTRVPPLDAVEGESTWLRRTLVAAQGVGILLVVVLALPTMRSRREDDAEIADSGGRGRTR